jgi:outer membrane murein-binding lipoprotein Lpp
MRKLLVMCLVVMLSGCATVQNWIPSFWDDNQSAKITDVRLAVDRLNCQQNQLSQITVIRDDLRWFELYSRSKGSLQRDVIRLIAPMQETVEDMYTRNSRGTASATYCELKKQIMTQQAERIAHAVLGRW